MQKCVGVFFLCKRFFTCDHAGIFTGKNVLHKPIDYQYERVLMYSVQGIILWQKKVASEYLTFVDVQCTLSSFNNILTNNICCVCISVLSLHSKLLIMNKRELFDLVAPKLQREFNPSETMQWLTMNKPMYWSWGVSQKINLEDKALLLKVSGNHLKGWVCIVLAWDDTYSIYYIDSKGIKEEQHNVYCDMLNDVIDDRIERIAEYKF